MAHTVTLVPGDGIGPEVMSSACRVVAATGITVEWDVQQVGPPAIEAGRPPLPEEALDSVRRTGVALKGPVTTPMGKQGFASVNVELRRALGMYVQVRPCRTRKGAVSAFEGLDIHVIRGTT